MPPVTPLPQHFPQTIYGIHDTEGASFLAQNECSGWLVRAVKVWSDPPSDFTSLVNQGMRVIVRLNNGYGTEGTIPLPAQYPAFAQKCADWVAASRGASIFIIGNEMNASFERPQNQPILPSNYVSCFVQCRDAIHAKPGHAGDQVVVGAVAPYNIETNYATNPSGDWIKYFQDVLTILKDRCDGIAIHTYSRGQRPEDVANPSKYPAPYQNNYQGFLAYQNFMGAIPTTLRKLPVYITETQPIIGGAPNWLNENTGWVRAAYAEIAAWNSNPNNQPIQALALFRWLNTDPGWCFSNKPNVLADFREAISRSYKVRLPADVPPAKTLEQAILEKAKTVKWMPVNNTAALWKYAQVHGLQDQQTDELPLKFNGEDYIVQVFNKGIVYVKVGDWGNIQVIPK